MKIKILNLYYDLSLNDGNLIAIINKLKFYNISYEIHFKTTNDIFNFNDYDLIYIKSIELKYIESIINDLNIRNIKKYIELKKHFLFTGNSISILGNKLICKNKKIKTLKLFSFTTFYTKNYNFTDYVNNTFKLSGNSNIKILNNKNPLFKVSNEGIKYKNLLSISLNNSFLLENEDLVDLLIKKLISNKNISFKFKLTKSSDLFV